MWDLKDKKALITGATGGIGREIAKTFVDAGAEVVVTGTREQILQEICEDLGPKTHYIISHLGQSDQVKELYAQAEVLLGKVDILICNAGITRDNLTLRMSDEEWDEVININLTATFKLNRAAIKKMVRGKYGRIINISSIVGVTGNFGQANYCASKAGMIGMTKAIALEVASRGITVNCIAPGFITTPMTQNLQDEIKQSLLQKIPMQRMGSPADIANSALFLASDSASYITGTTLHVNGGMYML